VVIPGKKKTMNATQKHKLKHVISFFFWFCLAPAAAAVAVVISLVSSRIEKTRHRSFLRTIYVCMSMLVE